MRLSEAARALDAEIVGIDVGFHGVSTDTRALEKRQLFVALHGPNFDGHDFLEAARDGGAAAAMVDAQSALAALPALRVRDTRAALGALAAHWRQRFSLPMVGVTGSNGKTTVKEMLASIFALEGEVLATRGNLNNEVGLPLTLLRLSEKHRLGVVELGASAVGEIAYLAGLARPTVGVITQCNPAHLEGFGSVEAVARAKGELLEALPDDGIAVINADDRYAGFWRGLAAGAARSALGWSSAADVSRALASRRGLHACHAANKVWHYRAQARPAWQTQRHECARSDGVCNRRRVGLEAIVKGLAAVKPVGGRMQMRRARGGARILDDSYNANPSSLARRA